ncbi:hypothetical protein [Noviherbaspirillum sedimenti]|uniref:Uncharacterized protein n=1 Tax=Noviherbaspirillum sedimenti TaxID=2320865 RepID=A0A3A3FY32_9BURK|nr:hypothetical protein [Noviherbaspirillum sedimenti]RJG01057.1 hypothetical protein D3878_05215 [Noviherbaspirillum sedimenti]
MRPLRLLRHPALPGLLLAALAPLHPWLEQDMMRHMAIELPLLFAIGWLAAAAAGQRLTRMLASWNLGGLPALLGALLVTGFWMIPAALDRAVLDDGIGMIKVVSLVAAGMAAGASWRSAGVVIQAFFMLNWFSMTLAAGLLYQEAPQQLCSVYLADQQGAAGMAVVGWAVLILVVWLPRAFAALDLSGDRADA